jgi:hypothetical protein
METLPLLFRSVGSVCLLDFYFAASSITHGTTVVPSNPNKGSQVFSATCTELATQERRDSILDGYDYI